MALSILLGAMSELSAPTSVPITIEPCPSLYAIRQRVLDELQADNVDWPHDVQFVLRPTVDNLWILEEFGGTEDGSRHGPFGPTCRDAEQAVAAVLISDARNRHRATDPKIQTDDDENENENGDENEDEDGDEDGDEATDSEPGPPVATGQTDPEPVTEDSSERAPPSLTKSDNDLEPRRDRWGRSPWTGALLGGLAGLRGATPTIGAAERPDMRGWLGGLAFGYEFSWLQAEIFARTIVDIQNRDTAYRSRVAVVGGPGLCVVTRPAKTLDVPVCGTVALGPRWFAARDSLDSNGETLRLLTALAGIDVGATWWFTAATTVGLRLRVGLGFDVLAPEQVATSISPSIALGLISRIAAPRRMTRPAARPRGRIPRPTTR